MRPAAQAWDAAIAATKQGLRDLMDVFTSAAEMLAMLLGWLLIAATCLAAAFALFAVVLFIQEGSGAGTYSPDGPSCARCD